MVENAVVCMKHEILWGVLELETVATYERVGGCVNYGKFVECMIAQCLHSCICTAALVFAHRRLFERYALRQHNYSRVASIFSNSALVLLNVKHL